MKKALTVFLFASGFVTIAAPAYACSELNLIAQPADNEGYNPNSLSPVALQIELFLENGPAEQTCASSIIEIRSQTALGIRDLSNGSATISGTRPSDQSAFASFTNSSIRLSQSTVDQLISTGRVLFEFSWIDAGTYYPTGIYTNTLDIDVNGSDVATVEPELTVYPAMRLLGDVSNGYGNIDFGKLESYKEASVSFIYQTNANLSVSATSQNDGNLIHELGASLYTIPYAAKINDRAIATNGNQSIQLLSNVGLHSLGTVSLSLGDIGAPVAGEYGDVLTLSFTAE